MKLTAKKNRVLHSCRWFSLFVLLCLSYSTIGFCESKNQQSSKNESIFAKAKRSVNQLLERFSSEWVDEAKTGVRGASSGAKDLMDDLSQVSGKSIQLTKPQLNRGARSPLPPLQLKDSGADVSADRGGDEGNAPTGGQAGTPPEGGRARGAPYWMPYCFLVDPAQDQAAVNAGIKQIVDEYAECGVAVQPFAYTIAPGYPQQPGELSDLARQACNFNDAFLVRGAVQLMVANPQLPIDMCQDDQAVGCSTLCERVSISMVAPGAGPVTQLHESLHSNCCGRLCVDAGEGNGEVAGPDLELTASIDYMNLPITGIKVMQAEEGENDLEAIEIPDATCASLQQGAAPNDGTHRYDPNKTNYYVAANSPEVMKQLNGRTFFPDRPPVPPDEEHPPGGDAGDQGDEEGDGDGNAQVALGDGDGSPESGTGRDLDIERIIAEAPEVRHRNQKLGPDGKPINDEGTQGAPNNVSNIQYTKAVQVADSGSGKEWPRVGFDDNAKKRAPSSISRGPTGAAGASVASAVTPGASSSLDSSTAIASSGLSGTLSEALGSSSDSRGFFNSVGANTAPPPQVRQRGGSLRRTTGVTRTSESGLSRQSDVLISTRPSPNLTVEEQVPLKGIY